MSWSSGREIRYAPYDIFCGISRSPWCRGSPRLEVDERVRSDGTVLKPLDPEEARQVVRAARSMGVESIAVCLLNSFENPAHELMIKEIIEKEAPQVSVSISYHVLPQIREYERTSTTVTNAYVKPLTGSYLAKLSRQARVHRLQGQALHHALERRHHVGGDGCRVSREDHRVRADRRGDRGPVLRQARSTSRRCSASTWAAPRPSPA